MYVLRKTRDLWSRRPVRWAMAVAGGALWWWAVLRLAVQPARTGPVEGMIAAGGWGLGLIPLRATCRPAPVRGKRPTAAEARLPRPRRDAFPASLPGHGHPAVRAEDLARHEG